MNQPAVTPDSTVTAGTAYLLGAVLIATGGTFCAMAVGWIRFDTAGLHAPREVLFCAGLLFALCGVLLAGRGRLPEGSTKLFLAIVLSCFALIPAWIAFGDGPREFGGSGSMYARWLGLDSISIGRVVFGLGAVLMTAMAAFGWLAWLAALPGMARIPAVLLLAAAVGWLGWGRHLEPALRDGESEQDRLARYISDKHAHPDYRQSKDGGGGNPFIGGPQETWIKHSRARLAAQRQAPAGIMSLPIPVSPAAPLVDGIAHADEWRSALKLSLHPVESGGIIRLLRSGDTLYVAGEAPADRTDTGFDQMRFYFHIDLAPALANERVFVGRSGSLSALRSVRTGDDREQTEWQVLTRLRGASQVNGHRHFELAIDLKEAGLSPGVAFPAFFEIEGDPVRTDAGKFKARHIEGRLGDRNSPLWLQLTN